jgi:glucan phosphoethanolaminetransferase (alkaline phosphatase superfamily)
MFITIISVLIYWMVFFGTCMFVVEVAQDQLYDQVTPHSGWKVAGGSLILALFATWLHPSYETMLTSDIQWTALQAIVWFLVFMFAFQFHPWHAIGLALVTLAIIAGVATMGVDSLTKPTPSSVTSPRSRNVPIRGTMTPSAPAAKEAETKPAAPAAK